MLDEFGLDGLTYKKRYLNNYPYYAQLFTGGCAIYSLYQAGIWYDELLSPGQIAHEGGLDLMDQLYHFEEKVDTSSPEYRDLIETVASNHDFYEERYDFPTVWDGGGYEIKNASWPG